MHGHCMVNRLVVSLFAKHGHCPLSLSLEQYGNAFQHTYVADLEHLEHALTN